MLVSLLTLLAICRITRLVTEDTITRPARDWIARRATAHEVSPGRPAARSGGRAWAWADKLVNCPWCAGFWISGAATLAYFRLWLGHWPHTAPLAFTFAVAWLASAYASALISDWLDSPPPAQPITITQPVPVDVMITREH